jgi:Sec-independent protein translocase protein TatA
MKGVGKGIKDFKDATKGNDEEANNERKELP